MSRIGVTERQAAVLNVIEDEVAVGRPSPNTVELARACGFSTGEIARILDALEYMGFISRIPNRRRNFRLCSPSVRMAPDDHLIAELTRRGYLVRKGLGQ
jgi:DNA-binding MarR family transcriptional regulator